MITIFDLKSYKYYFIVEKKMLTISWLITENNENTFLFKVMSEKKTQLKSSNRVLSKRAHCFATDFIQNAN